MDIHPQPTDTCAWYLRCSQPSQLLEHQRQPIERFCEDSGIDVPQSMRFEDRGGRRHEAAKRLSFQRLLDTIREEKIDWVLIAHLDRWGVANVDEFFGFRSMLREHGVRVWSVTDQLDLTSVNESDRWRIFGQAMANERAMITHAEKNIDKNIQMVLDGWWPSGNHAYGLDLMCCRLSDRLPLFRVQLLEFPDRKNKRYRIVEYDESGEEIDERIVKAMPSRNSKKTGYRLVPSVDESRIETVSRIFELFDQGMTHSQIGDWLHAQGITYFGKPFKYNTIDSILANPAYLGLPAWGKSATGHYRHAIGGRPAEPRERKRGETHHRDKSSEDHIQPRKAIFDPLVDPQLFDRVKIRLDEKPRTPKPRRRNRSIHPMNGLVKCPDCDQPMVNSHGTMRNGDTVEYFICSTYTRSRNRECRANSVAHRFLDECAEKLFADIQSRLSDYPQSELDGLSEQELTPTAIFIANAAETDLVQEMARQSGLDREEFQDDESFYGNAMLVYLRQWKARQSERLARIAEIEAEIDRVGDLIETTPSAQLAERWNKKLLNLEGEKRKLSGEPNIVEQLIMLFEHAKALGTRLLEMKRSRAGELWACFLDSVVPIMKLEKLNNGKTRTKVQGFRFVPKESASEVFGHALEIGCTRKDKDSVLRSR